MDIELLKQRAKAFDYLFDALVVTNKDAIIVDWNKGSEKLYGYVRDEVLDQPIGMLHAPGDDIVTEVLLSMTEDTTWTGEVRILHKDGHLGWVESVCVPVYDDNREIIGNLSINRDITERIKEMERLNYLAYHDYLTQLPNRYLLLERMEHLIKRAKRHKREFSLLYIDLDDFKSINDSHGHAFGDLVLKEMSSRMVDYIRDSDTIARVGGDEFVLLLEESSQESIAEFIDAFRIYMKQVYTINGHTYQVGCTLGVATFPHDGEDIDSLLRSADKAMYQSKSKKI